MIAIQVLGAAVILGFSAGLCHVSYRVVMAFFETGIDRLITRLENKL